MLVSKMHANGNDFCVVDYEDGIDYKELAIRICNRKLGVGAEGLIVVKKNPLEMLYYLPNGEKKQMNGNAIRCCAKYIYDNGIVRKNKYEILTLAGSIEIEVIQEIPFMCMVNMGKASFVNQMIYATDGLDCFGRLLNIDGMLINTYSFYLKEVNTIIFVESMDDNVLELADKIANYKLFARKTNAVFVKIINKTNLEVKAYEPINGWVLANGSACCSAVLCANKLGLSKAKARCNLDYGYLDVEINKKENVLLTGSAELVFKCRFDEED